MSAAATRTKVEDAIASSFEAVAGRLPGGAAAAQARRAALGTFRSLGLPSRRVEQWKYTDLKALTRTAFAPAVSEQATVDAAALDLALGPLAGLDAYRLVFIDGACRPELARTATPDGVTFEPLARRLAGGDSGAIPLPQDADEESVLALNTAFMTDGAVIDIADGAKLDRPLLLVFARASREPRAATTRNILRVGANAAATVIEAHVAVPGASREAQSNAATSLVVGDRATVTHVVCPVGLGGASHIWTGLIGLGAEAAYRGFHLTARSAMVRNQMFVTFAAEGAKLDISGAFLGRGSDHIDTTLVIDHAVGGCESRELFKGVLAGRARGVVQGKVIVRPDAQKTDGKQMAQVLMLSPDAEFDSKPELEIYADDVVCGHGSTVAEIDPGLVFYCRSRGIPEAEARALLVESFIGEVIDKVEAAAVHDALTAIARDWLAEDRTNRAETP